MGRFTAEPRRDWQEPLNIYLAIAMEPGESKSPAFRQVLAPLFEHQDVLAEAWKAECQRIDERNSKCEKGEEPEEKPPRPRLVVDDCTQEKLAAILEQQGEKVTLASDEGTVFKQACGLYTKTPNNGILLKAHSADRYTVDRMTREPIFLARPTLNLLTTVQPEILRQIAKRPDLRGEGLWARFAYLFPASKVGTRTFTAPPVDPVVRDDWRHLVLSLARQAQESPEEVRFSPEAWERLRVAMVTIDHAMGPGGPLASVRDWASKLRGLVVRLAGLLHVAETSQPAEERISAATVERALELGRYFLAHARYVFGVEMTLDPAEQAARGLWECIQRKGWTLSLIHI